MPFFPKTDAALLTSSSKEQRLPPRPTTVDPIFDVENAAQPIKAWTAETEACIYPPKLDQYAPSSIPQPDSLPRPRYLRPNLARNERLRLSMLWYYGQDIEKEHQLLSGLQEKACLAQESSGWEFAVVGLQDLNVYVRLATVGLELGILPRGETLCAHTVTQPPGSVFLLPNMLEDWRFRESPYVEQGGLVAYAGIPLRMQHESGDSVSLGSLCVASATSQPSLSPTQQQTLTRLADWVVTDIVQYTRARRQRERRRLADLLPDTVNTADGTDFHDHLLELMHMAYPGEMVSMQPSGGEVHGQEAGLFSDLENGLWEDTDYIDNIIDTANHDALPTNRVARLMSAQCESRLGHSLLVVATKDVRRIFDDVDAWFIQSCANLFTQNWQRCVMAEAMRAKETFLRGISHQLRTPLHGILGAAELLTEDLQNMAAPNASGISAADMAAKAALYLDTISGAGRELMLTVNSMITLSQWADVAATKRRYDLYSMGQLEAELLKRLSEATPDARVKPALFFHCDASLHGTKLRTDLSLLGDCLSPVVANAISNTTKGVVTVAFSMGSNNTFIVDIEDTGCGIRPEDQVRIFQLYEKGTEHSTGAGLGLPLATKFAALLHGSIELVSSRIDQGSHFRATFANVTREDAASSPQIMVSSYPNLPSKYRQLQPESSRQLSSHFARFLTQTGFAKSEGGAKGFMIFDYDPKDKQLTNHIERTARGQVSICLVPKSVAVGPLPKLPHLLYASEPFSTEKLLQTLREADELAASLVRPLPEDARADTETSQHACKGYFPPSALKSPDLEGEYNGSDESSHSSVFSPTHGIFSRSGSDTDFSPLSESAEATVVSSSPAPSPNARSAKPFVMVVDDNVVNLRILQMYCKKRGLSFLSAADGLQAVDTFTRHQAAAAADGQAPIELILMDLQMPVCDGFDATRQIRALEQRNSWTASVVFMVTGQDSPKDREAASASGADDYMVKPIRMGQLDTELKRYF